jgi:hypothetical protein
MKRRLLVSIMTAGVAAASGVASANTSAHTLEYYRDAGLLLEVSADPRDGTDFVQTNPTHAGRLELVAVNDAVRLRGLTVHFADGRSFTAPMSTIRVGERVMVDLPANCGVIQSVSLDYGRQLVDRTAARLQIIPHAERQYVAPVAPIRQRDHRRWNQQGTYSYQAPAYAQPSYSYQAPAYAEPSYSYQQPSYVVRPAPRPSTSWSGSIQGSFHF